MEIDLAGLSGGRVEQLSSLARRCAERLSVPFGDFYRELLVPRLFEGRAAPAGHQLPANCAVDGALGAAVAWTRAMNSYTGRTDLRRATLIPWRHSLAPRALARTYRAWCPKCLDDMATSGAVIYEPLVWRIAEISVCAHHAIRLECGCPTCGHGKQPSFSVFSRVGCCRKCGNWLGRSVSPGLSGGVSEEDLFFARAAEAALSLSNAGTTIELITSDLAVRAIRDVFYHGSCAEMGRALGFLPSQVVHFIAGSFPAPLYLFLRASYATGATMEQIFATNAFDENLIHKEKFAFQTRRIVAQRARVHEELVQRLTQALEGDGNQSVQSVADALNLAANTVWRREGA